MWELDHKEVWGLKNWCFWTVILEKTLESPLDGKESNQLILEEIIPEYSLEGLMLRLKLLILWPPDTKCWFIKKDPDAGKDWRQEEKGTTEDEMVGWYHRLNGHKVWASSGRWWRTRRPSVLQSVGSQRVAHDRTTEQQLSWPWAIQLWSPVCIWNSTTKTSAIAMPSWLLRNTLLEDLCRHSFCSAALFLKWNSLKSLSQILIFSVPMTCRHPAVSCWRFFFFFKKINFIYNMFWLYKVIITKMLVSYICIILYTFTTSTFTFIFF